MHPQEQNTAARRCFEFLVDDAGSDFVIAN